MSRIHDCSVQSEERQKINGGGGSAADSDSCFNLELTLGGSYGGGCGDSVADDEMPFLTLSSSVFESVQDAVKEDSGEPLNVRPPEEFAVERSFLSLRMSSPPAVPEMRTIKELQTMRRQEVKKRLMGKNRSRGRPPLPNHSHYRILFPAMCQPPAPPNSIPQSFHLNPSSPAPVSFFCAPSTSSSPPLSPMPLAFRSPPPPLPPPPPPPPPPPRLLPPRQQHSSLPLCPMPLSIIRPHRQSSSPPLSPRPSSVRLPPVPTHPHFPANGEGHKTATPESLPVEIIRDLVVRWLLQHKYKRHKASDRSDLDTGLELIKQMPTVVATGGGPAGKRIEGFLCKFGTEDVSLVCICHGLFFTPAEFVKHAGGDDVDNPMKQIIVCPASF